MKDIVVAMDFSDSALNAFNHALSVADKFAQGLALVWNETKDSLAHLPKEGNKKKPSKELALEQMKRLTAESSYSNTINFSYFTTKGTTYKEITRIASELQATMIITGTHGTHGMRHFFMGNNANKIIALAKCPVLTIQLNRDLTQKLERIVIAIDNTLETRQKLPITMEFAKKYGAEVHVLGIYTTKVSELRKKVEYYTRQAVASLKTQNIPHEYHFIFSDNISRTTINHAKKHHCNLIVTMVDTQFFTKDVFLGKQGQQLVNRSPVPVLSVHNREIIRTRNIL